MLYVFLLLSIVLSSVFADTKKTSTKGVLKEGATSNRSQQDPQKNPIKITMIKDVKPKIFDTKMTFNNSSKKTPVERYKEKHPHRAKEKNSKTEMSSMAYEKNDKLTTSTYTYDARKVQNQFSPVIKGGLADGFYGPRRK